MTNVIEIVGFVLIKFWGSCSSYRRIAEIEGERCKVQGERKGRVSRCGGFFGSALCTACVHASAGLRLSLQVRGGRGGAPGSFIHNT